MPAVPVWRRLVEWRHSGARRRHTAVLLRLFAPFDPVRDPINPLPYDLIFIDGRGNGDGLLCAKFGTFSFSRFGFIVRTDRITDRTRNKSNDYFESMQYRQDVRHIAHYHKRKHFPSNTRCSENHNNTCAENRKIRGLKFDTLYWRHLAAYRKI